MRTRRMPVLLCAAICLAAGQARAQGGPVILGVEDPVAGFVGPLVGPDPRLFVASDGEAPFFPFGLNVPVSDAIQLNSNWRYIGPAGWLQAPGTFVWYLPEPAGAADPLVEPIGHWIFIPGNSWNVGTPEFQHILEPGGAVSDVIRLFNDANGNANITFQSGVSAVPEPATVLLLASGLALVGARRRLRRR